MRIHHIATVADWRAARRTGSYATSTRGRTLAQEGFIHAARPEQVRGVFERYYRDAGEPLVLLGVETDVLDRLGVPWREDPVGDDTFPQLYAALPREAVVSALPLDAHGRTPSLLSLYLREALPAVGVAVVAMLLAGLVATGAGAARGQQVVLPTALAVLVVAGVVGWWVLRRVRWP